MTRLIDLQAGAMKLKDVQLDRQLVSEIQSLLARAGLYQGAIDGLWGPGTHQGFAYFAQRINLPLMESTWFGWQSAQQLFTLAGLPVPNATPAPAIPPSTYPSGGNPGIAIPGHGAKPHRGISEYQFQQIASQIGISVAALKAIAHVEASGSGFLADGRPKILFERHIFSKETQGRFDTVAPDLSNKKAGGYQGGEKEYPRLYQAIALDRNAALRSASWGLAQVMGFNHKLAGYPRLDDFIAAMHSSEALQLQAMAQFLVSVNIVPHIQQKNWPKVAELYNGRDYRKNRYDEKLASAYDQFA